MAKKQQKGINPELEDAINTALTQVMNDSQASITDRMKVIDRALKLEAIKMKMSDYDEWGSGFSIGEDEE